MNILVTGGTGYIGSHTVVELLNNGFDVHIVDNLSNSSVDVLDSIEKITGKKPAFNKIDLCNYGDVENVISINRFDGIIHFAAYKAVGESVEHPLMYYKNNLVSLMNVLELSDKYGIRNLVFSSSCSVYGEPDYLPVDELAPIKKAMSPYGNTKQIGEEIIHDFIHSNKYKAIALRYFNPIGAHDTALIGELPINKPNNLIPIITQTAIGKNKLSVFGNDYHTPDGTCIRDYIHVVDVAKAHLVAVDRLINGKNKSPFEIFNLGTGQGNSVLEAIQTFEKVAGVPCPYTLAPRREGDVEKVFADTSLANRELGWKAELSFEEAIRSAWKWEQHLNG
ncbi:MAG: UDP-glucose 4-epimerase GalE [Bacteroidota bacterium]